MPPRRASPLAATRPPAGHLLSVPFVTEPPYVAV